MGVFVLPSYREGLPLAPMEASAMNVPCVVTDIRGCRDVVEHKENGLVVPLGDVEALANAIVDILTDDNLAERFRSRGREIAAARFDEAVAMKIVEDEYARLLQEHGIASPAP